MGNVSKLLAGLGLVESKLNLENWEGKQSHNMVNNEAADNGHRFTGTVKIILVMYFSIWGPRS